METRDQLSSQHLNQATFYTNDVPEDQKSLKLKSVNPHVMSLKLPCQVVYSKMESLVTKVVMGSVRKMEGMGI